MHLMATQMVVRYLKASPGQGLFFTATNPLTLTAYCDSDWGGCKTSRQSFTGYCIIFGQSLISWKCKQHTISRFSIETEYRCMANTCCEINWLLILFKAYGLFNLTRIKLVCDSKCALYIASNLVFMYFMNVQSISS